MTGIDYEDQIWPLGYYQKPHGLIVMAEEGYITKAQYILLDLLLHIENRLTKNPNNWFFCTDEALCKTGLISSKTLKLAKKGLVHRGLIEYKSGHSHMASEYRILIPGKCYYKGSVPRKSK